MRSASLAAAVALGATSWAQPVRAAPQVSVGVTGAADLQSQGGRTTGWSFQLGGRADALFLRDHNGQMAVGPYIDGATAGFHDIDVGGGVEWLIPLTAEVPMVLSAGGLARSGDGYAWAPGVEGTVFVGSRSFNFHSWYGLAAGGFVQTRWVPATPSSQDVVVGVQMDLELIVLPALFLWDAAFASGS